MSANSAGVTGLKLVVFGFHLSVVGRLALQSFAVVLIGVIVSIFGLALK